MAKTRVGQTAITVTARTPATSPAIAFGSAPVPPGNEILARLLLDLGTGELPLLGTAQSTAAAGRS